MYQYPTYDMYFVHPKMTSFLKFLSEIFIILSENMF